MINTLKKIFEANPKRSTIELKDKCSECGKAIIISITKTSGGFGLNGGALFKNNAVSCLAKCPDCNKLNPKINEIQRKGQV